MQHTMPAFFRHAARAVICLCLAALAAPCAFAQEPAREMLVQARAELHRERNDKSPVVAVLAPGEKVLAGLPKDGWLAVFRQGVQAQDEASAAGFLPAGLLKPAPASVARPAQPITAQPAVTAQPTGPSQKPKAQQPGAAKEAGQGPLLNKQEPVRVTSDKLTYKQAENAVVFEGNVYATHGDMALWSNKLTAYFAEKKKTPPASEQGAKDQGGKGGGDFSDKIERIVAEGNVRMVSGKNEGFCGKLTYFVAEDTLRMDDNPILRENDNTVRGEIIKYYLKENRSEVLSGAQRRVEAIFKSGEAKPGGK